MKCFVCYDLNDLRTCDDVNAVLNACEKCQWYYDCDGVLVLNDKLKELEEELEEEVEEETEA